MFFFYAKMILRIFSRPLQFNAHHSLTPPTPAAQRNFNKVENLQCITKSFYGLVIESVLKSFFFLFRHLMRVVIEWQNSSMSLGPRHASVFFVSFFSAQFESSLSFLFIHKWILIRNMFNKGTNVYIDFYETTINKSNTNSQL